MEQIILSENRKVFGHREAQELLPLVFHITEGAYKTVKKLASQHEAFKCVSATRAKEVENLINEQVTRWQNKLTKLGVVPKGLWLADFDNGQGYYCWKYPETEIRFWHGYKDGFSGRVEIQ